MSGGDAPAAGYPGEAAFAEQWAAEISRITYVPMRWPAKVAFLAGLTAGLAAALRAEPFDATPGYGIGAELAAAKFAAPEALARTMTLLHGRLVAALGLPLAAEERVAALAEAVGIGHSRAVRDQTLDGQDALCQAAVQAREVAERELRAEQDRARHAALHDPITELANRLLFTERLARLSGQTDERARVAIVVVDLDNFKPINNSLGLRVGDRLLKAVGARLAGFAAEHGCLLARLDGAEFALLVENSTGAEEAVKLADRILNLLGGPIRVDDHHLIVLPSAGVVERAIAGSDPADALRSARSALHWAQQEGSGRCVLFNDARNTEQLARYEVSAAMPGALATGEFTLDFQPLVELGTGRVAGVEALARWTHPRFGRIPPSTFIPLAEQTGLMVRLGRQLLAQACRFAAGWWREMPLAPYVSVNVAAAQIRYPGIVGDVATALDRAGLPAHQLQLEITETVALDDDQQTRDTLKAIARLGVRLAIDDFGTGYANHACLTGVPLHALKLDASFADSLHRSRGGESETVIMASMIDLGRSLGLRVTAEGARRAQVPLLREMRCDLGQGYELGAPVPASEIPSLLAGD